MHPMLFESYWLPLTSNSSVQDMSEANLTHKCFLHALMFHSTGLRWICILRDQFSPVVCHHSSALPVHSLSTEEHIVLVAGSYLKGSLHACNKPLFELLDPILKAVFTPVTKHSLNYLCVVKNRSSTYRREPPATVSLSEMLPVMGSRRYSTSSKSRFGPSDPVVIEFAM
eukprot:2839433-Amphidinium_carterae.2